MKRLFLSAAMALASTAALAQPAAPAPAPQQASSPAANAAALEDADPALWVVRDEDTTVYLFGTFHLLDGRPWFNDEVKTAFDASDELVVEAIIPENPAEVQPLIMRYAVDPEGRKLSERLSADQYAALTQALATVGAPAAAFDPLEPWFVSMTLAIVASQRLGISAEHGPEAVLIRAARERDMPVDELEGIEWQIRLFDSMPEEQQIAQLRQAIDNLEEMAEALAPMLAAWSTGDTDGMQQIIVTQSGEDPELHRLIFTDRNRSWAEWIQERMARPGTVFLAVGAGHLAGEDSVQGALRTHGLNAERVPPSADGTATPAS